MAAATRHSIRFLLDGAEIQLDDVDPNRTVLQWLREDHRATGTKEGCAEGDCGACAVVIAELVGEGDTLQYRAINSCIQFLPTLDGKELITVESLQQRPGQLHPVQQAMVDEHGSQCGFCTPGFVMSLYALYENDNQPSRARIDDALAGNLCRCTGYKPIIRAATKMYDYDRPADKRAGRIAALKQLQPVNPLHVSGSGRQYFAPRSLSELAEQVEKMPGAQLLAGGTDIGLWVTKDHRQLDTLIYVGQVPELQAIEQTDSAVELGAAVTLSDAMPVLMAHFPGLTEVLYRFAGPPIRNAATIGGNIANGSPIGDSMPALLALDATLLLRRGSQTREMPLDQFFLAYQKTALQAGEFIERVRIPLLPSASRFETYKISKRYDQDISAICGAYCVTLNNDRVEAIRIAYGGVAAIPVRAPVCEKSLLGATWNEKTVRAAAGLLEQDFKPISDMRASAAYRAKVSKNLLLRFFHATKLSDPPVSLYRHGR